MILITAAQCRAARALLNWSQPELAERCGMHVQTISAFENENGSPTKTTLQKIAFRLEQAGIEFNPPNSVSLSENKFYTSENYADVLDDCLHYLKPNEEILFHCADDRLSNDAVLDKLLKLSQAGIRMRATTCKENDKRRSFRDYKILPADYFSTTQLTIIFRDKFSLNIDETRSGYRFLTIKNANLANIMRRQFEYWWKNGKEIPT